MWLKNSQDLNLNQNNNQITEVKLDKRILPLFNTPITLKKINEKRRNKYNFNLLNPHKKLSSNIITLNQIFELFLKGITKYNINLQNYLLKRNKLGLILQLCESKNNNYKKLNILLSNYIYKVNKYLAIYKIRSLLYNINLFYPHRLFKPEPQLRFIYRLRNITKLTLLPNTIENGQEKIERSIEIKELIAKVKKLVNYIKYKINQTNIKNQKIQTKQIFNIILPSLDQSQHSISSDNTHQSLTIPTTSSTEGIINNNLLLKTNASAASAASAETKITLKKIFHSINKSNEISIKQTMNSIMKNNNFDYKTDSISLNSNPISILYNSNNKPILNQYIKSMSIYNMRRNGIILSYSNIIGFNFNSERNKLIKKIYELLSTTFKSMYCLISKPVFVITPDKIIIQLFYYLFIPNILKLKKINKYGYKRRNNANWMKRKTKIKKLYRKFRKIKVKVRIQLRKLSNISLVKVFPAKFQQLCEILSHLFKKPVELNLIRLHYPYNDSHILVNLLGIMINRIKLRIITRRLFEKAVIKNLNKITKKSKLNIIPAFLSGMTIRVAGRLLTQRVIPRQTIKTTRRGASARGKINFSDVARFTNKNKRGAFSITVTSGQNFN